MSLSRMRDSPTRIAWAPQRAKRSTSARVWIPLSATRSGFRSASRRMAEAGGQPLGSGQIHFESLEVAIVNADELCAGRQGAVQFRFVVHLDQRRKPASGQLETPELRVAQHSDDQENRIGSPFDRLQDLPLIDDEILPQQRQLSPPAGFVSSIPANPGKTSRPSARRGSWRPRPRIGGRW